MIETKRNMWVHLIRACVIVLFSQSATTTATQAFRPMPMDRKLEYSDAVFLGTVRKIYFFDHNNSVLDASKVKGITASMAEVEVSQVIVDRKKKLKSLVRVPLGDPTSPAQDRIEKYNGKTFVFFGQFLYADDRYGKSMPFVRLLPDDGVDSPSQMDEIRKAVKAMR